MTDGQVAAQAPRPAWSATPKLASALVAACKAAEAVTKDARNKEQGYQFAPAEVVFAEARGALSESGLTCEVRSATTEWHDATTDDDGKLVSRHGVMTLWFDLLHESGEERAYGPFLSSCVAHRGRPEDKAEFSTRTSALSYFVRDLLLLPRLMPEGTVEGRDDSEMGPAGGGRDYRTTSRVYKPGSPTVPFGVDKGKLLTAVPVGKLRWLRAAIERSVADPEKAAYLQRNARNLADVDAEIARRAEAPPSGAEPAPAEEPPTGDGVPVIAEGDDSDVAVLEGWRDRYRAAAKLGATQISVVHAEMVTALAAGNPVRAQLERDHAELVKALRARARSRR